MVICRKCDKIRVRCKECKSSYGKCDHYKNIDQKRINSSYFICDLYGCNYNDTDDYCLSEDDKTCTYDKYKDEILYCCYVKANCFEKVTNNWFKRGLTAAERCRFDNSNTEGKLCRKCDIWVCKYHCECLKCECIIDEIDN